MEHPIVRSVKLVSINDQRIPQEIREEMGSYCESMARFCNGDISYMVTDNAEGSAPLNWEAINEFLKAQGVTAGEEVQLVTLCTFLVLTSFLGMS